MLPRRPAQAIAENLWKTPKSNVGKLLLGRGVVRSSGARAVRLEPAEGVRPTLFVPAERGYTATARAALPPGGILTEEWA